MFDIGLQELIVIFIVALLIFGPKKLPELSRTIGRGLAELRNTLEGVKEQVGTELKETIETPDTKGTEETEEKAEEKAEEKTEGEKHETEREGVDARH